MKYSEGFFKKAESYANECLLGCLKRKHYYSIDCEVPDELGIKCPFIKVCKHIKKLIK
jgi:hypothetical protein